MTTTPKKTPTKATKAPSVAPNATSETPPATKPKGKGGAPKGSVNAIRHGLKCGTLPKDAKYIELRLNALRRTLEAAVLALRGEVDITDAALIQSVTRWERHSCLAQRWLTKMQDELKPEQRLTFSREIASSSSQRDKAISALRLGKGENTPAPWLLSLPLPETTDTDTNGGTDHD